MAPSSVTDAQRIRGRLPVAARDRRPALAALALLLVLVGALGSALLVFRSGDRVSVLATRGPISFGQVVTSSDFKTIRVASDGGVALVAASQLASLVNERATGPLPANSLINPNMFTRQTLVPNGGEAVGIVVDPTRRPSSVPQPGQVVRVYYVAGSGTSTAGAPTNPVVVNAARVLAVGNGASVGTKSVTVLVSDGVASDVANFASSGNLAVSVLPDNTKPAIDWTGQ